MVLLFSETVFLRIGPLFRRIVPRFSLDRTFPKTNAPILMKHFVTSASSLTFFSSRKLSAKSILVACVSKSSSRLSLSLFCHEAFFSIDKVGLHRETLSSFFHLSTF